MKTLYSYKNGNYVVGIFEDGTKVRSCNEEEFKPAFAENIDIKITNRCNAGCAFCHEGSTVNGENADLFSLDFINSLHKGQELAIGGGNIFENGQLVDFLKFLKEKGVIPNITVNQCHFAENYDLIKYLSDNKLVYGIGVSVSYLDRDTIELIKAVNNPNIVIHVINGILDEEMFDALSGNNFKMLILGYKTLRRGESYKTANDNSIIKNQHMLKTKLFNNELKGFSIVSFDNLAIEQLDVESFLSKEEWDKFYMGDDGTTTFYIDCVEKKFARSSTAKQEDRFPLLSTVDEMFKVITE